MRDSDWDWDWGDQDRTGMCRMKERRTTKQTRDWRVVGRKLQTAEMIDASFFNSPLVQFDRNRNA